MSSEIEAAGAAITAGLVAGAIERPGHGKGGDGQHGHGACANCGAPVDGKFCAACGQPAHIHRTLGHMVEEFFHGILHFDTKAWRTLPLLIFRPGTLTHEYVHGKRARFVSPLAFFLFAVFLMFFVFALLGESGPAEKKTRADLRAAIATLDTALANPALDADARADIADDRADLAKDLASLDQHAEGLAKVRPVLLEKIEEAKKAGERDDQALFETTLRRIDAALGPEEISLDALDVKVNATGGLDISVTNSSALREAVADGVLEVTDDGTMIQTGNKELDKKITKKLKNPDYLFYKIENTAYKFAFLLVPLGLPFVWLVFFWKRGVTLFDHTVFLLYSLTFVSLVFMALMLLLRSPIAGLVSEAWVLLWALPVHLFFQLKGGYALGFFSALWRTLVLMVFSTFCLAIFLVGVLAMGLLG